jgi:hypothetical protein
MDSLSQKMPRIFVWLGFGILFAALPILILDGLKLVDKNWNAAEEELRTAPAQGELLLVVAAILVDSIGRLVQDVVTNKPPALVGLKLGSPLSWRASLRCAGHAELGQNFLVRDRIVILEARLAGVVHQRLYRLPRRIGSSLCFAKIYFAAAIDRVLT